MNILRRRFLIYLIYVSALIGCILSIWLLTNFRIVSDAEQIYPREVMLAKLMRASVNRLEEPHTAVAPLQIVLSSDATMEKLVYPAPNYDVHVFYYPWYGSPAINGRYYHWNHSYLPHWDKKEAKKWPIGSHAPPEDIGSNFYPLLGPYSSSDPVIMNKHMKQIRSAGVGVLAVSWYPADLADEQGQEWDSWMSTLMDVAHKYELKICFHIEPFKDRSVITLRGNISYILTKYGTHPAFYRRNSPSAPPVHDDKLQAPTQRQLPLFYIYDSYLIPTHEWHNLFSTSGAMSLRGTDLDAIYIGLLVTRAHTQDIMSSGFDGFYTYFASDKFSYGSTFDNWRSLAEFATANDLLFLPCVGPGYVDDRVRPWNARNTRAREGGAYYERSWAKAVEVKPRIVSVTSFNEWHEGTQIEEAVPFKYDGYTYMDYQPMEPDYYLSITRKWAHKMKKLNLLVAR